MGSILDGSRLFVYKTTRNLMGVKGDTGAWLRNTMAALAFCGVPPEKYHPYTNRRTPGPEGEPTFDDEPSSFVYSLAEDFRSPELLLPRPAGHEFPARRCPFQREKVSRGRNTLNVRLSLGFPPSTIQMSKADSPSLDSERRQYGATQSLLSAMTIT